MFGRFRRQKKLWKPFIVFFLISFVIINWDSISWIFNYKAVSGMIGKTIEKQEVQILPNVSADSEDNSINNQSGGAVAAVQENINYLPDPGVLEIPKLGVTAPLIFVEDPAIVQDTLAQGVVHWPGSPLPGQTGQSLILGHSAPPNWPKIRYEWVFSRISELNPGDEVKVSLDGRNYIFRVTRQIFLERGEEIPTHPDLGQSHIYLITCWPPGKDIRRIAVEAELIGN